MADKEMFSYWVTQPELIEKSDIPKLERLTTEYPYFQLAHMLLGKAIAVGKQESLSRYLPKAAIYSPSRKALQMLLENEMEWSTALLDKLTRANTAFTSLQDSKPTSPPPPALPASPPDDEPLSPMFDPSIAAELTLEQKLQKESDQTPVRRSKTPVQDLIEKFIKAEPTIGPPITPVQTSEVEDLSLRSQVSLEDFATESFAEILAKQGKFDKAIGIYEKLILQMPEKKDYFAEKIKLVRSL